MLSTIILTSSHSPSLFVFLTFLTKTNIDSMFVAAGPVFVVSTHFVDALFHSGDIGLCQSMDDISSQVLYVFVES